MLKQVQHDIASQHDMDSQHDKIARKIYFRTYFSMNFPTPFSLFVNSV